MRDLVSGSHRLIVCERHNLKILRFAKMNIENFKLSCELYGHALDVRAVTQGPNSIISGSRDRKVKIWDFDGFVITLNYF